MEGAPPGLEETPDERVPDEVLENVDAGVPKIALLAYRGFREVTPEITCPLVRRGVRNGLDQPEALLVTQHEDELAGTAQIERISPPLRQTRPSALRKAVQFREHPEGISEDVAEAALLFECARKEPFDCFQEVVDLLLGALRPLRL